MLESKIQTSCINYAKKNGWYCCKTIKVSVSGFPDLIMLKNGVCVFVEFKSANGIQSELQKYQQKLLENQGFKYFLVNNLNYFKEIVVY
jgi:Holliday junction resolvase-like predicted endonuclease